eukprot:2492146-Heterocapsa_arctica.AAC.1
MPQLPIGNAEPVLPDAHAPPPVPRAPKTDLASDAASSITKKRKITDVRIQQFEDTVLEDALRTWRGILNEMGKTSGLCRQIVACESSQLANRSFAAAFF